MLKRLTLLITLILVTQPAYAQERAAVMDLRAKGNINESDASIITDRIRSLIVQNGKYQVMERENMDRILREQGFQASQNCESTDCSIEIGKLLSVHHMITGSASRLGNLSSLQLRIIDVEKGTILRDEYRDCVCPLEDLMTQKAPGLVQQILTLPGTESQKQQSSHSVSGDPAQPVRQRLPWLAYLEGGWPRYASGGFLYNLNPFFAVGANAGVTAGGNFTINVHTAGTARFYFNPHDLAGYAEILAEVTYPSGIYVLLVPRLGVEYRQPNTGLTLGLALGAPITVAPYFEYDGRTPIDATATLGFAF
jgi:hypothetical protein